MAWKEERGNFGDTTKSSYLNLQKEEKGNNMQLQFLFHTCIIFIFHLHNLKSKI